eukprot:1153553-Pelagomonas_calceolata.AAC.1
MQRVRPTQGSSIEVLSPVQKESNTQGSAAPDGLLQRIQADGGQNHDPKPGKPPHHEPVHGKPHLSSRAATHLYRCKAGWCWHALPGWSGLLSHVLAGKTSSSTQQQVGPQVVSVRKQYPVQASDELVPVSVGVRVGRSMVTHACQMLAMLENLSAGHTACVAAATWRRRLNFSIRQAP